MEVTSNPPYAKPPQNNSIKSTTTSQMVNSKTSFNLTKRDPKLTLCNTEYPGMINKPFGSGTSVHPTFPIQLPRQPVPLSDIIRKPSIRVSSFARDPAANIEALSHKPEATPTVTVHHRCLDNTVAPLRQARFIWYPVESQYRYSIVNSDNHYIILNTFISCASDICVKLFVSVNEHKRLPKDPALWENCSFTFLPDWNLPTKAIFYLGRNKEFELRADLPVKVFNLHDLVNNNSAFILSSKRLKSFQQGLMEGKQFYTLLFYFNKNSFKVEHFAHNSLFNSLMKYFINTIMLFFGQQNFDQILIKESKFDISNVLP